MEIIKDTRNDGCSNTNYQIIVINDLEYAQFVFSEWLNILRRYGIGLEGK